MIQLGEKRVSEFMTKSVISVEDTGRLSDAIRIMDDNRLSAVPVLDSQAAIVGILSTSDMLNVFHEIQSDLNALHVVNDDTRDFLLKLLTEAGDNTRVCDVMTKPVVTADANMNLVMAARLMADKHYHHLPIVSDKGSPIGMLSTSDFVRAIAMHGATMAG